MRLVGWAMLVVGVGVGCGSSREPDDRGVDAGREDAGRDEMDAGTDATILVGDAGGVDAGEDAPGARPDAGECVSPREICVVDGVEVCANLLSDESHCGECGNACDPDGMCTSGACRCPAGVASCRGDCANLETDPLHCGFCGNDCGPGGSCTSGTCTCGGDLELCMRRCIDVSADPLNCGGCFLTCGATEVCTGGDCVCAPGFIDCGRGCVDTMTSPSHCGMCGISCGMGGVCTAGICECAPGLSECGPACIDLANDRTNCGMCGNVCPGTEVCIGGTCGCTTGFTSCGGTCRNTTSDRTNCGMCGNRCPGTEICVDGACGCSPGQTSCGGTCRDLRSDRTNCGMCGNVCPAGQLCFGSACTATPPTRYTQTTVTAAEAPWIEACSEPGHTEHLGMRDDAQELVMLPFPFRYWATDLPAGSPINITTNGWMGMDGMPDASLGGSVPEPFSPNAVIAPHWGDDYTRGPMCVATVGTAPSRQFVVQWNDTHYCCDGAGSPVHNTFEVVLSESIGTIDLIYLTMDAARPQTQGIEDQTGTMGINSCPGGIGSCTPVAGDRIRFVPSF